jgi:RES domain-containing protein
VAVVYATPSIALAVLETIVHLNSSSLPLNRYVIKIEVPDDVWAHRVTVDKEGAPGGWDAEPAGSSSLEYGDAWVESRTSALLSVPSVMILMEQNVLINPLHPEASRLLFTNMGKFVFDARIRKHGCRS